MTLEDKIAQASRHVETGRGVIERQRAIVARYPSVFATDLLDCFERTQAIFESDMTALLAQRAQAGLSAQRQTFFAQLPT